MTTDGQHPSKPSKRVAILIEQFVEDSEFLVPYTALQKAGAEVVVLGSRMNEIYQGKHHKVSRQPDGTTTEARATEFDAVVIPGGMAPDRMRVNPKTVQFVQDAMRERIWVAAVCHGPQVLIEGDVLRNLKATGFIAIRKDLQNAGAHYIDAPLVVDGNLITARRPGDLPIFTTAILKRLGLTIHDTTLPDETDMDAGWWKLGEEWGGSSKAEIVSSINTAIAGERYGLEAFEHYADRVHSNDLRIAFQEVCVHKKQHIQRLSTRLAIMEGSESLQASASGALATLRAWLQGSQNEAEILRRALGDLQTGVVDTYNLRNQLSDPATTQIFDQMEVAIAQDEQRIVDLYHARLQNAIAQPPRPTSSAAVSG